MSFEFICFANNSHQLEKANTLSGLLDNKLLIIYQGNSNSLLNSSSNIVFDAPLEFLKSNPSKIFKTAIFFTLHANKDNYEILKFFRKKHTLTVAFQETFQLSTHNEKIFNIILSPDIIISSSYLEKKLIIKNCLFPDEKIIDTGWIFKNIKFNEKSTSDQNKILVLFGASPKISSISGELDRLRYDLLQYISREFPWKKIEVKLHPQDSQQRRFKDIESGNIKFLSKEDELQEIINDYEIIFCSEKTQAMFDLVFAKAQYFIFSFGNENIFYRSLSCKPIKVNKFITVKKFNQKYDLDKFESIHGYSDNDSTSILKLISQPLVTENDDIKFENVLWDNYFEIEGSLCELPINHRNLFKDFKSVNLQELALRNNSASLQASSFLILLNKIIKSNYNDKDFNKDFIKYLIKDFLIVNFPYQSLRYYLFLLRNQDAGLLTDDKEWILKNIYEGLINRLQLKTVIKLPAFLLSPYLLKYRIYNLIINKILNILIHR